MGSTQTDRLGWPRRAVVAVPAVAIAVMHALESVLGHDRLAVYGPAVASLIAAGGGWLLTRGFVRRFESLALVSSALLILALVPVWIEGEMTSAGGLSLAALHGHDLPTLLATVIALYAFAVVSGARLLADLLRGPG